MENRPRWRQDVEVDGGAVRLVGCNPSLWRDVRLLGASPLVLFLASSLQFTGIYLNFSNKFEFLIHSIPLKMALVCIGHSHSSLLWNSVERLVFQITKTPFFHYLTQNGSGDYVKVAVLTDPQVMFDARFFCIYVSFYVCIVVYSACADMPVSMCFVYLFKCVVTGPPVTFILSSWHGFHLLQLMDRTSLRLAPKSLALEMAQFYTDLFMRRAFSASVIPFKPDVILFLGDYFDGGPVLSNEEYVLKRCCFICYVHWFLIMHSVFITVR